MMTTGLSTWDQRAHGLLSMLMCLDPSAGQLTSVAGNDGSFFLQVYIQCTLSAFC